MTTREIKVTFNCKGVTRTKVMVLEDVIADDKTIRNTIIKLLTDLYKEKPTNVTFKNK